MAFGTGDGSMCTKELEARLRMKGCRERRRREPGFFMTRFTTALVRSLQELTLVWVGMAFHANSETLDVDMSRSLRDMRRILFPVTAIARD